MQNHKPSDTMTDIIIDCVKNMKEEPSYNLKDAFAVIKKIKIGINGGRNAKQGGLGVYTTSNNNFEIKNFLDLSNVGKCIYIESDLMPVFYFYIYKSNENEIRDYNKLKSDLGTMIGKQISISIENKLRNLI